MIVETTKMGDGSTIHWVALISEWSGPQETSTFGPKFIGKISTPCEK
jgi:hypothetical protein